MPRKTQRKPLKLVKISRYQVLMLIWQKSVIISTSNCSVPESYLHVLKCYAMWPEMLLLLLRLELTNDMLETQCWKKTYKKVHYYLNLSLRSSLQVKLENRNLCFPTEVNCMY